MRHWENVVRKWFRQKKHARRADVVSLSDSQRKKKQTKLEQHLAYFKGMWNHGRYPVLRYCQQRLKSPFKTSAHIQKGPRGLTRPPVVLDVPGGSQGCCSAEQQGHLLIRHSLFLSHTHGLTQVDGQDVFALREQSADTDVTFKDASHKWKAQHAVSATLDKDKLCK